MPLADCSVGQTKGNQYDHHEFNEFEGPEYGAIEKIAADDIRYNEKRHQGQDDQPNYINCPAYLENRLA